MKKLNKKREKLLETLNRCAGMVKGSITSVCSSCNRAGCICKTKSDNKAYRLTYKDSSQKTKMQMLVQLLHKIGKTIYPIPVIKQTATQNVSKTLTVHAQKASA